LLSDIGLFKPAFPRQLINSIDVDITLNSCVGPENADAGKIAELLRNHLKRHFRTAFDNFNHRNGIRAISHIVTGDGARRIAGNDDHFDSLFQKEIGNLHGISTHRVGRFRAVR
jgi:hypothetical protein